MMKALAVAADRCARVAQDPSTTPIALPAAIRASTRDSISRTAPATQRRMVLGGGSCHCRSPVYQH
jgi:hypothetical protein